ncbi:MAG: hypothetical protein ACKO3N_01175 [Verrucomicrobiota bacterium]
MSDVILLNGSRYGPDKMKGSEDLVSEVRKVAARVRGDEKLESRPAPRARDHREG